MMIKKNTKESDLTQYAVIYCRVSSKKQKKGDGLGSQETRCREHAVKKGYQVEAVFPDDVTGAGDFMKRPGMVSLLKFLDAQPNKQYVVVFDDLKRFARDTEFHIRLRRAFKLRKATVECLNFKFEDTPEGKFIETIIAAQGALEREQNGRQVVQKMKARLKNGWWVFSKPKGYIYEERPEGGKKLVRDEPLASIVQEALEGFASGRLGSQAEVKRFLESQPAFPKDLPNGEVRFQQIPVILTQPLYAGYLAAPKWNISLRKAQHEPIISMETFEKIQDRLCESTTVPARKDSNQDFPLRGFVLCGDCEKPLTGSWSKSRTGKKHPYYRCYNKQCISHQKSIPRQRMEDEFEVVLRAMQPAEHLYQLAKAMFSDAWNQRMGQIKQTASKWWAR